MVQLTTTMATGADVKKYNDEITGRIEAVQTIVTELGGAVGKLDSKVCDVDCRVNAFEENVATVEECLRTAERGERVGGPDVPGGAAPGGPCQGMPRIVHIRGWNPYGSPAESKLTKEQARQLQAQIAAAMSAEWCDRTLWLTPFVQNHCISAELLMADNPQEVKKLADNINLVIKRGAITVADKDIRATVETSPRRREYLRQWFQAREHLAQLNPDKEWTVCERALEIWIKRMTKRFGYRDATTAIWLLNAHAAAQEGP